MARNGRQLKTTSIIRERPGFPALLKKALSVLMLCVFIFTPGSSALLEHPRCGLSIWLLLLVILNTLLWVYVKTDKNCSKSAIVVWYENGCRRLFGAQSINTERASISVSYLAGSQTLLICHPLSLRFWNLPTRPQSLYFQSGLWFFFWWGKG